MAHQIHTSSSSVDVFEEMEKLIFEKVKNTKQETLQNNTISKLEMVYLQQMIKYISNN